MNAYPRQLSGQLYHLAIEPKTTNVDSRRREFILNVLLSVLAVSASLALVLTLLDQYRSQHIESIVSSTVFWAFAYGLLVISRRGRPNIAAYIFAGFLLLSTILLALSWGFAYADVELLFALNIVIAGVLFSASRALLATALISAALILIALAQVHHLQHPQTYWQREDFKLGDAIGFMVIFILMGVVSWLSNREIAHSLERARASEAALQTERDNLEVTVAARTRELEELQLKQLLELQPFAEFGRIGAGLVHEIANPLTAASLHLQQLDQEQNSALVRQVQRNLQRLEQYLLAARKQIKRQSRLSSFAIGAELRQITKLLASRAHSAGVVLVVDKVSNIRLYGDVVKFNQVVANLLANAIEASESVRDPLLRRVLLQVKLDGDWLRITVSDYGIGIQPAQMEHLFEPFYSTKTKSVRSGLGIGLALVKQYAEQDFRGTITVTSSPSDGTVFELRLRSQVRS